MSKICDRSPPARAARLLAVVAGAVLVLGVAPLEYAYGYSMARIKFTGFGYYGLAGVKADFTYDGTPGEPQGDEYYWGNSVYAGQYEFDLDADNSSPLANQLLSNTFYAYCIDLKQNPSSSSADYEIRPLEATPVGGGIPTMGVAKANDIREMFGRVKPQHLTTNTDHEAFAACIWEIVYEKPGVDYDLDSGWVQIGYQNGYLDTPPTGHDLAEGWLGSLNGDESMYDDAVFALSNEALQDFTLTHPGMGGIIPVIPEPLTMVGALMGVCGLAGYLRRRKMFV